MRNMEPVKVFKCMNGYIVMPLRGGFEAARVFPNIKTLTTWLDKHFEDIPF